MSETTGDLLFWIVTFVGLFLILRWLNARKKRRDDEDGRR